MAYTPDGFEEDYIKLLPSIIQSGFSTEGQYTKKCESFLSELFGKTAMVTSSWGTAFQAVLSYYRGLKNTSEEIDNSIIVFQSNSFYGAVMVAREMGFEIAYTPCDDRDTLNMSLLCLMDNIKALRSTHLGRKIVVVLTHIGGWVNKDVKEISDFCKSEQIVLIEDCAHSFHSKGYDVSFSGTYGDVGIFSFYATKAIQAGEGGALISKDSKLMDYVRRYARYDREQHHKHISLEKAQEQMLVYGQNTRISEYQALALYVTLNYIGRFYDFRMSNINRFHYEDIPVGKRFPDHLYERYPRFSDSIEYHNYYKLVVELTNTEDFDWYVAFKGTNQIEEVGPTFDYSCPVIDYNNNRSFFSLYSIETYESEQEHKKFLRYLRTL